MENIPYSKQSLKKDDINAVIKVLKSDFLTTGPKIKEFENKICEYTKAKYCVCVSNGTAALHLSSLVLLKENDKVLTTVNSFLATSNAILYAKAKPIFVDICEDGNIDLELCEKELKKDKSIKAIYAVHFSGKVINQEKLKALKDKYKIKILEDCSHSLGASFKKIRAGGCLNSDISTFSFHPVKNLTTGEGGAITTNCRKIYEKLLLLRNHGMKANPKKAPWHYDMLELGFNYRLTDMACALGISQFQKLDNFLEKRKNLAKRYEKAFLRNKYVKALYSYDKNSAYHLYVVKISFDKLKISKKDFVLKMREKQIFLQYHYIPINKQVFYKKLGYGKEHTPIMDKYYKTAISLPLYSKLSFKQQDYVIKCLNEILNV